MPTILQQYTDSSNTQVIGDTAAPPGSLPTPAVSAGSFSPAIDGNSNYIWSPNTASGQTVQFRSVFVTEAPILQLSLPIAVTYAFAGNETVNVSGTLEVLNILGIVVLTVPLFAKSNGGNPSSVAVALGNALIAAELLGGSLRFTIDATVVAPITLPYQPDNTGRYLGEITVQSII